MNIKNLSLSTVAALALLGAAVSANAVTQNFSFTGNLTQDNSEQLFNFTVGATSPDVILRTWSYAGGVNAAGQTIPRGGFDPILAVFDSSGTLIGQNDDGLSLVAADAVTGEHYDTYLDIASLAAGTYTVAVMQYDNFANGPALANGFRQDGAANAWFRNHWYDVTGNQRDSAWAFDVDGVQGAQENGVPDGGSTVGLLGLALSGLAWVRSRLQK
jgi:hypothetical protein